MKIFNKKPILVLDIDGVFNSLSTIVGERYLIKHKYGTWQITKENAEFLKHISALAKCYWISTWQDESNVINDYLGIKHFKSIYTGDKIKDITKIKGKKILLVDDEISAENFIDYDSIECLQPNQGTGLVEENRSYIYEWINQM